MRAVAFQPAEFREQHPGVGRHPGLVRGWHVGGCGVSGGQQPGPRSVVINNGWSLQQPQVDMFLLFYGR